MDTRSADWHLLFGLLALQNGLISREQLVTAFAKWTSDKSVALDELLVSDGAIDPERCDTLKRMVKFHVQSHGGDPQQSLMSLGGSDLSAARSDLEQLDDSELHRSMAAIPDGDVFATSLPTVGLPTSTSGRFRILRPLPGARGGMGEISVAKDEELGRQVALKQILPDKADHSVYRQKFQVEAEVTGNLEHPGIVPVYGLGAGPDGRPYYAMRLVHGDNLSAKIKQFHEGAEYKPVDFTSVEFHGLIDRLIDVAQAVRYAHSRGVLHRDLKPGNILVGEYGETLVIDWGLARLPHASELEPEASRWDDGIDSKEPLHIRSGSNVDATSPGQALGTVGYAPPEQINGRVDLITERSDVYSLGAILYQILTGRPPVSSQDKEQNVGDLMKQTIEGNITAPSRVNRSTPKSLSAICMQALQREPSSRYESVSALIAEIERWKADQPITAAPDSTVDRLLRLARRHRTAVMAAAAALLGIAIVSGVALVVVNRARVDEAAAREKAETLAAEKTQLAEEKTELANRNQKVVETFVAAFRSADPENEGVTNKMTALDVLEQALVQIEADRDLAGDELTKATLLNALGTSLLSLGEYNEAISALRETLQLTTAKLGPNHPDTITSIGSLAVCYEASGQPEKALPLFEESLRLRTAMLGPEHPDTITSMGNLAIGYQGVGKMEQAISLYEETLRHSTAKLGPNHPDTLTSMNNLASGYRATGQLAEALPLFEEALRRTTARLGAEHPDTLTSLSSLAMGYQEAGRLAEALPLFEEAFRLSTAKLGPKHPHTLSSMGDLAGGYEEAGRLDEALPLYEETIRLKTAKLGRDNPSTLSSMNNLASGYLAVGRVAESLPLLEETLRLVTAKLGPAHPDTLVSMGNLAMVYQAAGRLEQAIPLFEESLRLKNTKLGPEHSSTLSSMINLAFGYEAAGRLEEALPLWQEVLRLRMAKLGTEHADTISITNRLQETFLQLNEFEEARKVVEDWFANVGQSARVELPQIARARTSFAEALLGLRLVAESSQQIDAAIAIDGIDAIQRFRARGIQGANFALQGKWEKAESLLIQSVEALTEQLAEMNILNRWYVTRTCERVIAMYEAWGKLEEVGKWKAKLAEVNAEIERLRNGGVPPEEDATDSSTSSN